VLTMLSRTPSQFFALKSILTSVDALATDVHATSAGQRVDVSSEQMIISSDVSRRFQIVMANTVSSRG